MTHHQSDKTLGDAIREQQDSVITTMVILASWLDADDCRCLNCRIERGGILMTIGALTDGLMQSTGLTAEAIANRMTGDRRRIIKGIPT